MEFVFTLFVVLASLFLLMLAIVVFFVFIKAPKAQPPLLPPEVKRISFDPRQEPEITVHKDHSVAYSDEWLLKMGEMGEQLLKHNVQGIYLVHGTFVGNDPFTAYETLEKILPGEYSKKITQALKNITKRQSDQIFFDSANFCDEYQQALQVGLGGRIPVCNVHWNSGNHHLARLRTALDLVNQIALTCEHQNKKKSSLLFLAHSHGGQILALLSHLINRSDLGKKLFEIARRHQLQNVELIVDQLKIVRDFALHFVTLGTPYRYPFVTNKKSFVLHVLNHRHDDFRVFSLKNFLYTIDGDYTQKWGQAGSDFIATSKLEREINKELDLLLGAGQDLKKLYQLLRRQDYLQPQGITCLVDFNDQGREAMPNAINSVFGHGIYTKISVMHFVFKLIVENWDSNGYKKDHL